MEYFITITITQIDLWRLRPFSVTALSLLFMTLDCGCFYSFVVIHRGWVEVFAGIIIRDYTTVASHI